MTAAATRAKIQAADRKFYAQATPKPRLTLTQLLRRAEKTMLEKAR